MVTVRGEEEEDEVLSEPSHKPPLDEGGRGGGALPDLVARPLQLDVGLRELTLTPGVTLEISLQQDLVMTVRLKQDRPVTASEEFDKNISDRETVAFATDEKDLRIACTTDANSNSDVDYFPEEKTKEDIVYNLNGSMKSPVEDDTKDVSKSIFTKDVSEVQVDEVTKFLNSERGFKDAYSSSDDDEEWTTQNVEELTRASVRKDEGDSTEEDEWGEIFEDCRDYEEVITDFGCESYFGNNYCVRDSLLHTIIEEDEEDEEDEEEQESTDEDEDECRAERRVDGPVIENLFLDENEEKINDILSSNVITDNELERFDGHLDSDAEKSELEQFEILEQLCSSSSDDFDPDEFCKVRNDASSSDSAETPSQEESSPYTDSSDNRTVDSSPDAADRISSFKEYLKRKGSSGSDGGKNKGEYVNKLTLVQEDDGRAKVKPVDIDCETPLRKDSCMSRSAVDSTFSNPSSESTASDDGTVSYYDWKMGSKPSKNESVVPTASDQYAEPTCDLFNKTSFSTDNVGALNTILRSKIVEKTLSDEDHNFERKITTIDTSGSQDVYPEQKSVPVDGTSGTNTKILKSILKSNTNKVKLPALSDDADSSCLADVSSSSVSEWDRSTSTIVGEDNSGSDVFGFKYSGVKDAEEISDASFEWRELSIDRSPVNTCENKRKRVNFEERIEDDSDDSIAGCDFDEYLEERLDCHESSCTVDDSSSETCERGSNSPAGNADEGRRSDVPGRMAGPARIDVDRPQVNVFGSGPGDPTAYDSGSDLRPSSPSMRTKRDGSKTSSSKETDQSSSCDGRSVPPKSALKKPGKKRKKHKVQFDESLNKFFEADYVILIREDECECGGELCCSSFLQDDEDEDSFADLEEDENPVVEIPEPPIEFVDQLTLSPPDGYKDTCLPQTVAFHQQRE